MISKNEVLAGGLQIGLIGIVDSSKGIDRDFIALDSISCSSVFGRENGLGKAYL